MNDFVLPVTRYAMSGDVNVASASWPNLSPAKCWYQGSSPTSWQVQA
jgi:hypothetical protein